MMKEEIIKKYLKTEELGNHLELFDKISYSTNNRVAELIDQGIPHALVIADVQEGGRGRIGRSWISGNVGESIAMSFSCMPGADIKRLPFITPLVALAVTDVLGNEAMRIKWPNDIVIDGKKVCGILCELKQQKSKNYVIVGIGINVFQKDFPDELCGMATSLLCEGIVDQTNSSDGMRERIVSEIVGAFEKRLNTFLEEGFAAMYKDYNSRLYGVGCRARILDSSISEGDISHAEVVTEGTFLGTDECGMALIEAHDGIKTILSGELSLRID